ncbi:MAG: lecithin retinol acyltransferase family protein [Candidatus Hydrogenedentes bacterium]|nr:lecithin retinol acyltransferase family protein [Candidatus Hydrogenedentota bacterium]
MALGDHIRVRRARGLYWHHGIDAGDGNVIHFSGEPFRMQNAVLCEVPMEAFLQGGVAHVVRHDEEPNTPEQVVAIARSHLGSTGYDLMLNNCEHFACYCKTGKLVSRQVARAVATAGVAMAGIALSGGLVLARAYLRSRIRRSA